MVSVFLLLSSLIVSPSSLSAVLPSLPILHSVIGLHEFSHGFTHNGFDAPIKTDHSLSAFLRFFTSSVLTPFFSKQHERKFDPSFVFFLRSIHAFAPLWVPLGTTPFYLQPRAQPLQCIPACAIPSNQRFLFLQPNCVSFFQEWETCDWFCMHSVCRV